MHVLIVTQVYPPEIHPTAVMFQELARYLAQQGHDVTVAAGYPHHPHGRVYDGYEKRLLQEETSAGVRVLRGWHLTSEDSRFSRRASVMASQAVGTVVAGLGARSPDVVVTVGLPLVGPLLSAVLARRFGARLVSVIYDLYPDVAIDTGRLDNGALIWLARQVERISYAVSDRIIVLSGGFKRTLQAKGVSEAKIEVLPVWLDPDEIRPMPRDNPWRREQNISPATKVILYAGTIGIVSGAQVVLDAADAMRDHTDTLFLFVGEGRIREELRTEAQRRGLSNVRFLPFQPRERLPEVQATADLALVTLAPGRGRTSVPSKVVGYMAAGRPVLASVDDESDTAVAVRAGGCGVVVRPGDPQALAAAAAEMLAGPDRLRELGTAARAYFEREYARPGVLARFGATIVAVASAAGNDAAAGRTLAGQKSVVIRPMTRADVRTAVQVHVSAFPSFFLTFLGPRFLDVFYSAAVDLGEPAFVATMDDRVVGFVMGSSRPGAFYRNLLRTRLLEFAWTATPAVVRKPSAAMRVARALLKPKQAAKRDGVTTLMSLGVDPQVQGVGAGKRLVKAFLEEAARRGARTVDLTTDKIDNEKTNGFYMGLGFRVARQIVTPENRILNEYEIGIPAAQARD